MTLVYLIQNLEHIRGFPVLITFPQNPRRFCGTVRERTALTVKHQLQRKLLLKIFSQAGLFRDGLLQTLLLFRHGFQQAVQPYLQADQRITHLTVLCIHLLQRRPDLFQPVGFLNILRTVKILFILSDPDIALLDFCAVPPHFHKSIIHGLLIQCDLILFIQTAAAFRPALQKLRSYVLPDPPIPVCRILRFLVCLPGSPVRERFALHEHALIFLIFLLCQFLFQLLLLFSLIAEHLQLQTAVLFQFQCMIDLRESRQFLIFLLQRFQPFLKLFGLVYRLIDRSCHFKDPFLQLPDFLFFSSFSCQKSYKLRFTGFVCLTGQNPLPELSVLSKGNALSGTILSGKIAEDPRNSFLQSILQFFTDRQTGKTGGSVFLYIQNRIQKIGTFLLNSFKILQRYHQCIQNSHFLQLRLYSCAVRFLQSTGKLHRLIKRHCRNAGFLKGNSGKPGSFIPLRLQFLLILDKLQFFLGLPQFLPADFHFMLPAAFHIRQVPALQFIIPAENLLHRQRILRRLILTDRLFRLPQHLCRRVPLFRIFSLFKHIRDPQINRIRHRFPGRKKLLFLLRLPAFQKRQFFRRPVILCSQLLVLTNHPAAYFHPAFEPVKLFPDFFRAVILLCIQHLQCLFMPFPLKNLLLLLQFLTLFQNPFLSLLQPFLKRFQKPLLLTDSHLTLFNFIAPALFLSLRFQLLRVRLFQFAVHFLQIRIQQAVAFCFRQFLLFRQLCQTLSG